MGGVTEQRVLPSFEVLGPLRAWRGGDDLDLGPGKQRAVLAVLLLNANRPVGTAQIVDAVWRDEPPENGANVVQKYVAGLRRVLEPDRSPRAPGQVLALTDAGYVLSVEPGRLDADVFAHQVRQAYAARAEGRLAEAGDQLREALRLWRGEALAGLSGPLFDSARERLADSRAAALEAWADVELRLGRHAELVPTLAQLVAEYPVREELRYHLILALYRCGRQAESLAAFRDARRYLVDEFGVEPGERLRDLHQAILRADPSLAAPPGPAPPRPATAEPVDTPAPVPRPAPRRTSPLALVLSVAVPAATCGTGSCAVLAYYAARRRSLLLGLNAAGYLAIDVLLGIMLNDDAAHEAERWLGVAILLGFIALVAGTVQGAVLSRAPARWARPADLAPGTLADVERRIRREQARQLVYQHPAVARELGIGRPDLQGAFDDGGLVDVNAAPVEVIAALPGVGWEQARRIVAHREAYGALSSVDDLASHGLLPYHVLHDLHDRLVVVP